MNTDNPKLCKDCIHCLPYPGMTDHSRFGLATCRRSAVVLNLIDGTERHRFCENERTNADACGPEARHFEPDDCDNLP
jgi:hypothetical protein